MEPGALRRLSELSESELRFFRTFCVLNIEISENPPRWPGLSKLFNELASLAILEQYRRRQILSELEQDMYEISVTWTPVDSWDLGKP